MSYPRLVANGSYGSVDVRQGSANASFDQMTSVHSGSCYSGQAWEYHVEGAKMTVRTGDGAYHTATGVNGIQTGQSVTTSF